jgi:hypothetical protein
MSDFQEYKPVEIVVVGAGLAGSLFLSEIIKHFQSVAVLDAGNKVHQSIKEIETKGKYFHPPGDKYRRFGLGGSSSAWAGRCVIYDKQDFEFSKLWPLPYKELNKYYQTALKQLDAEIDCDDFKNLTEYTGNLFKVNENDFSESFDIYSKPTDTFKKFEEKFNSSDSLKIYNDHVVTSLDNCKDKLKIISGFHKGKLFHIKSKIVVICNGGLETTKFLLNLQHREKVSISSALGKYYMTHYAGTVGRFYTEKSKINYGYGKKNNIFIRLKYLFRKKTREDLSFTARIHFPDIDNPEHSSSILSFLFLFRKIIGYEYGLRLSKGGTNINLKHIKNIILKPFSLIKDIYFLFLGRYLLDRKIPPLMNTTSSYFNLDIHCEQSPSSASKISLSEEKDDYGLYKLNVEWVPNVNDLDNLASNIQTLIDQVGASCEFYSSPSKEEIINELLRHGAFGGHFIGTTRMGVDASDSVVDKNLNIHGLNNVFVLSSSTFPTASHANPSLTIAAFAIRLANHLKVMS